ncbi:hypothetical protein V5N11_022043 [Cardamine amara subsp. amara]|uniref:Uncharacterized protein n=1 Tax=Cardamine amara subsp. amara TaxID=228776 RepID=A0ABD1AX54_CARAN
MSSKGSSKSTSEREVKKEVASVIPVKRKPVINMAAKAIISALTPSGCSGRNSDSTGDGDGDGDGNGNGARVYPTHR